MNSIEHDDGSSTDDKLDAQRDIIRQSINEIANDIGMAMRDVGLTSHSTSPFGTLETHS